MKTMIIALGFLTLVCGSASAEMEAADLKLQKRIAPFGYEFLANASTQDLVKSAKTTDEDGNSFYSPVSMSLLLSMLENGAAGNTQKVIGRTLNQGDATVEELNRSNRAYVDDLKERAEKFKADKEKYGLKGDPFELGIDNAMWSRIPTKNIEKPFLKTMVESYRAEVGSINPDATQAAKDINGWAAKKTNGKVTKIIEPDTLADPNFRMLLANATYAKGSWEKKCETEEGAEAPKFKGFKGADAGAKMMRCSEKGFVVDLGSVQVVKKDLIGGVASMYVIVPKKAMSKAEFEAIQQEVWSPGFWSRVESEIQNGRDNYGQVNLRMPKFTYKKGEKMNDLLKGMGMGPAFCGADFTGISKKEDLFLSYVRQDTCVNVDENGFEGAAVSSAGMMTRSAVARPDKVFDVTADKPFLYAVRDVNGGMLFGGSVVKPTLKGCK